MRYTSIAMIRCFALCLLVCLLLAAGPGQRLPAPGTVTEQVALQRRVLEEDEGD